MLNATLLGCCFATVLRAQVLDEVAAADRAADAAIVALVTQEELLRHQQNWRAAWVRGIGGLPERTPLNAQEGPVVRCDGFTLQNILFESQPGVYVVGHLALPDSSAIKPPYPAVLMPMGHSDAGIVAPRYAAHFAMMARAGFAAFSWDPLSQGERRQSRPQYDYADNCSTEHTRLGFRGWLVGWNFARFRIWDGLRALDYLETRRDVDCSKMGVCGTSGGGTMSAYLQALDPRIKVAFPNCYISNIRRVFAERGCHDAEQFFWNQLNVGVNHAAMLAMGFPRVSLATGSRWKDYFPQKGAEETFAVYSALCERLAGAKMSPRVCWHFHCDGPHGLPLPTRQAQVDWMVHCIKGGPAPKPLADYWSLSTGDHSGTNDPCTFAALPFPTNAAFFTASHQVRDLLGFRSMFDLLAERARELAKARAARDGRDARDRRDARDGRDAWDRRDGRDARDARDGRDAWDLAAKYREIVRRRAGIRPLEQLLKPTNLQPFDHPKFNGWYLKGVYGCKRENEAAMLATLGRSVVGREAERIILNAAKWSRPRVLRASGWDCIAAAHAYAAEPQLFSSVEFSNPPVSWTEMVTNPDPKTDSFAVAVWGALEEYDWTDLVSNKEVITIKE